MRDETDVTGRDVTVQAVSALSEEEIDLNLIGSFPASDPPSWTLGIDSSARTDKISDSEG